MAEILGNQTSRQESATSEHKDVVTNWQGTPARAAIGLLVVLTTIGIAITGLDYWQKLILGVGLWYGGGKFAATAKKSTLKDIWWIWPQVMKAAGVAIIIIGLFLTSGFGMKTKNIVNNTEKSVACSAGEKSTRCSQWRAGQAAKAAAEQEARLQEAERQAAIIAARTPQPIKTGLGPEAYLAKIIGVFTPIKIENGTFIGPIGNFKGTCLTFTIVDGDESHFELWSRPDTTSAPVQAETKGARVIKVGHSGPTAHEFYAANGGDITLALERKQGINSCS